MLQALKLISSFAIFAARFIKRFKLSKCMYAIVEIAGRQYRVEENQFLVVNRLSGNEGDKLTFDKVLLIGDKGKMKVGEPTIKGAVVSATIEKHGRGDKVVVFKKKRRKGYVKRNGHRQDLTRIKIESIKTKAEKAVAATTEEN